ncbi:MAG: hypothetical protein ABIH35_02410 [Patescibacteria group bacterium]
MFKIKNQLRKFPTLLATFALAGAFSAMTWLGSSHPESANLAAFSFGLGDGGIQIGTDNFSFGLGVGGAGDQPGCSGSNCLSVPSAGTYKGIAVTGSLTKAILNWTNFFLGFFALIAMVALIYAGFLYVTAAGNDEQATKAKKIIIWVVIGIIVILLAYALVNTLITTGPKGGDY